MNKVYKIEDYINFKNKVFELLNLNNDIIKNLYNEGEYKLSSEFFKKYALYDLLMDIYNNKNILDENQDINKIVLEAKKILPDQTYIDFGKSPNVLACCKFDIKRNLQMPKRYLIKSQTKDEDHSILDNSLLSLKENIENPICITESNAKEIITLIINDKSESGKYIIVPISEYNNKSRGIFINQLDSIYGKSSLYNYLQTHKIIAYNNKKMNELMSELSLQLRMCDTKDSFTYDDSITNSLNFVNKNLKSFEKIQGEYKDKSDKEKKGKIIDISKVKLNNDNGRK